MTLEDLSSSDLEKIAAGDLESLSDQALHVVAGETGLADASAPQPNNVKDLTVSILKNALSGAARKFGPDPISSDLVGGTAEGFLGTDKTPSPSMARSIGRGVGRYGPAVGGSLILVGATGGAAAPVLVASGVPAAGALTSAGALGLGAAGGEAYRELGARATGGESLESGQAASKIGKTGLEAAMTELGIRGIGAAASAMLPSVSQILKSVPAEAVKRGLANPDIIPAGGNAARSAVEEQGVGQLAKIQGILSRTREVLGRAKANAMKALNYKTGGARIFDLSGAADNAEQVLAQAGADVPATAQAIKSDLSKIQPLIDKIRELPVVSASELDSLRRAIDGMTDFTRGGVPEISSEVGQRVLKQIGTDFRQGIAEAAQKFNLPALTQANANFSKFATIYDELRPLLKTVNNSTESLLTRFNSLAAKFNEGGLRTQVISDMGKDIPRFGPIIQKEVSKLLDIISAREFTRLPTGTPSGLIKDFAKLAISPANIGRGIKISPAVQGGLRATGIAIGGQAMDRQP